MSSCLQSARAVAGALLIAALPVSTAAAQDPAGSRSEAVEWATPGDAHMPRVGRLVVPADRHDPERGTQRLAVTHWPAIRAANRPPLLYLAFERPSRTIARSSQHEIVEALRATTDVYVLDVRGTGASGALECPETVRLEPDHSASLAVLAGAWRQALESCREEWLERGAALDVYTPDAVADDLDGLVDALGLERMDLWAVGNGTQLALHALRRFPERFGRVVLGGVVGPRHTVTMPRRADRVLDRLAGHAADESAANIAARIVRRARRAVRQYRDAPVRVTTRHPAGSGWATVAIDGLSVQAMLTDAMASREGILELPGLLAHLDRGIVTRQVALAALGVRERDAGALGYWLLRCAAAPGDRDAERIARQGERATLGRLVDMPLPEVCRYLGVGPASEEFLQPVGAPHETLFIRATLDIHTPAPNAVRVARGFDNARHLLVVGGTHEDLRMPHAEMVDAMLEFLGTGAPGRDDVVLPAFRFLPPRR